MDVHIKVANYNENFSSAGLELTNWDNHSGTPTVATSGGNALSTSTNDIGWVLGANPQFTDYTFDNIWNVVDVVAMINCLLQIGPCMDNMDWNDDGVFNVLDIIMVCNVILGTAARYSSDDMQLIVTALHKLINSYDVDESMKITLTNTAKQLTKKVKSKRLEDREHGQCGSPELSGYFACPEHTICINNHCVYKKKQPEVRKADRFNEDTPAWKRRHYRRKRPKDYRPRRGK